MNENQMKMVISPSVGILVAGVASGICYLLIGSLRKSKGSKSISYDDSRCACCLKPFLVGRGVECNDCGARSCRKACCRWDSVEDSWFCLFCYHSRLWAKRREKWFRSFGGLPVNPDNNKDFRTTKSRIYDEGAEHVAIHTELDLAAGGRKEGDSMETVREFVEKIVEGLVDNVDDTPIDRLYDHPAYDRLFQTYGAILASTLTRLAMSLRQCIDNKPATDTPTMAHTALRELVERAVDEARKLPCLGATVSNELQEDSSFSEQNYEDLLATAILNKVIEKFQNDRVDGNSNVVHKRNRSKYVNHDNEIGLDEGVEEGSSSLEPLSQDECSSEESGSQKRHTRIRTQPLSLTIEEQIEEVTTYTSEDEPRCTKTNVLDFRNSRRVPFPEFGMDIVDPSQDSSDDNQEETNDLTHVDVITPVESWEENWLFQRRKIQTQSEPVSMLVPNPSADYRALIGDKDADDTSDLSEFSAQSDDDEDDEIDDDELIEAVNRSMPKSSEIKSTNYRGNEKILCENGQMVESLNDVSTDDKERQLDNNVNEEFEQIFRQDIDDKYEIYEKTNSTEEKRENGDSGLSENSYEPLKYLLKNPEIPKTPATSPLINSLSEYTSEVPFDYDFRRLNERLLLNDKIIDVENEKSAAQSDEEKVLSPSNVNEELEASLMKGCLDDLSRISETPAGEKIKLNGDAVKIEEIEKMTNSSSTEAIDSERQSLAEIKVVLTSEKSISRNATDDEIELATPPRPGTIAEREHKKWENAAPIENNPYSEENIQKRLLARQYARRSSSDVSGTSTKLQTSPSPPLQIVLGAGRPDFKRFGRDYYINEAKSPNGRSIETGFYMATSRPNSSMSQNSLSTGSDYEHQERSRSVETESTCSTSSDFETKKNTDSRRNNAETAPRRDSIGIDRDHETRQISCRQSQNDKDRRQSAGDVSRRNSIDEILESERKNNKNEINARLNNHGNFDDNTKLVKRINLRAYGFTNEFKMKISENDCETKRSKPIINKLDLRSFGYDSGLRRTQSNNNIDGRVKINLASRSRAKLRNFDVKSNLSENNEITRFSDNSSDEVLTKSTESLNESPTEIFENFGKMKSAKSVPNIGELCSRINDTVHMENQDVPSEINGGGDIEVRGKLSMPSVRRLAQAFNKTEKIVSTTARRPSKTVNISSKERPTTPEIHIIDTPRQMHSLTARSISREFREGLRQITSQQTVSPKKLIPAKDHRASDVSPTTTIQVVRNEDSSLIAPGKLKSNINFWEQMHRKS